MPLLTCRSRESTQLEVIGELERMFLSILDENWFFREFGAKIKGNALGECLPSFHATDFIFYCVTVLLCDFHLSVHRAETSAPSSDACPALRRLQRLQAIVSAPSTCPLSPVSTAAGTTAKSFCRPAARAAIAVHFFFKSYVFVIPRQIGGRCAKYRGLPLQNTA